MNSAPPDRAMYQGSRLHLRVNRFAAADLAELLSAVAEDPSPSPDPRQIALLLPDGRQLDVTVQVTDTGEVRDARGRVVDYDGCAYADVSGDFTVHIAARRVIDRGSAPYRDRLTPERATKLDERRIQRALDQHLPAVAGDERLQVLRDDVARRAMAVADATRDARLASAGTEPERGWGWPA